MKRYTKVLGWLEECNTGDVIKAEDFLEYEKTVEATYSRFGDDLVDQIELARNLEETIASLRADMDRIRQNRNEFSSRCASLRDRLNSSHQANRVYLKGFLVVSAIAIVALAAI
jgi:septal ring factor EnvC (AmiA/AmiB activator)